MAQHGYLREWDEGWDRGRDDDRERSSRSDRDQDRGRDFMFGDHDRGRDQNRDRGFFDRMGDRARQSFGDDDRQWRGSHRDEWSNRDRGFGPSRDRQTQGSGASDWERSPRNFSSHQDDHYVSWRNRQMEALDRDYADYCREREQQFHQDFDTWRGQRRGNNPGPLRTGMTQTGQSHDPSGMLELTNEAGENEEPGADPIDAATLGTNSSSGKRG